MRTVWTVSFVEEGGGIKGYVEELPGTVGFGKTIEECERDVRKAIELTLAANRWLTADGFRGCRVVKVECLKI